MLDNTTLGTIQIFPYTQLPSGWAECDGRLLPVREYMALTALIGTRFGGDGIRTIALPDLRGRVLVGAGPVIGLAKTAGAEQHTLSAAEVAAHTHTLSGSSAAANTESAIDGLPGTVSTGGTAPYAPRASSGSLSPMAFESLTTLPSSQPHENRQPYQVLVYAMAIGARFPDRARPTETKGQP